MENTLEKPSLADKEKERLARLYGYNSINSYKQSGNFKHVASMAAHIFNVPIAVVNFVGEASVLIESSVGMDAGEFDREISLCSLAILEDEATVFENAREEPCLLANPIVHGDFGLRFYAATPIKTADGYNIGVVAIADKKPRVFSKEKGKLLKALAAIVMKELEERLSRAAND